MKKKMNAVFKIIILISLIINSLTDSCSSIKLSKDCTGTCEWKEGTENTCAGILSANDGKCASANADSETCLKVKSEAEALCTFTEGTNECAAKDPTNADACSEANADSDTCLAVKDGENAELCTFTEGTNVCAAKNSANAATCNAANADSETCLAVKSTPESLCTFTEGTEGHCKEPSVTFKELTIQLTSVKAKNVEVTIIPNDEDIDKKVTSDTIIENLQLSSGSSFTEDLTCKISTGSKLGTVKCTMEKAATKDNKYKLIAKGESKVNLKGDDTFNGVKITDNEVTATEDNNNNNNTNQDNSSYLKFSVFVALLVILF